MARGGNPFYYGADANLGAAIGSRLAEAIFGNPEKAAQQAQDKAKLDYMAAQAEEARAHAGLYGKQGEGYGIQNDASRSLPDLIKSLFTPRSTGAVGGDLVATGAAPTTLPEAAAAMGMDPGLVSQMPNAAPNDLERLRAGLPAAVAAMAQMKGDNVNPGDILGTLSAFMGDDEMARRGIIAQGHTPTDDFALTTGRADAISARDAAEAEHQAVTTANISANTQRRGQDIRSSDTRRGQDLQDARYDRPSGNTIYRTQSKASAARNQAHKKLVPQAVAKALGDEIDEELKDLGADDFRASSKSGLVSYAINRYQEHGNQAQAVREAVNAMLEKAGLDRHGKPISRPAAQSTEAKPAPKSGKIDIEQERREAKAAIGRGAPANLVAQRFKQRTGQDL